MSVAKVHLLRPDGRIVCHPFGRPPGFYATSAEFAKVTCKRCLRIYNGKENSGTA
jgi:hypothetical protein